MLGAKYPSTAGGQYLIKAGIRMMRGIPKPAPETKGWYDIASFLFGTIIRAHSFSDGNGRVAPEHANQEQHDDYVIGYP
jgi:hypothetical protein